ncbi:MULTISPECIES: PD40 domain-containing protein [Streptomyces]|uniref:Uncharacterized protein n=2 Tax=Streptomyces TaxID=1883 RepID=A0A2U9NVC4_STRAS|nr:PD40 domain-containing protein [Streptomyces actuosus]AWT41243.1 hypothetical protein DMT42_02220 [Streptomyces actuosus]MBM4826220.1 PD40 domain-containing protein [Streptomyces actuosus]
MPAARLVATVEVPLDPRSADAPELLPHAGRRLVIQRGDAELAVVDADSGEAVRFPAPWPRRFGTATVSPDGRKAVFAGTHAVRCVDVSGAVLWEVRHGCWSGQCPELHREFAEYADDPVEHAGRPDGGSAALSPDGKLVWAHVLGPLPDHADALADVDDEDDEFWLVLDAADGRVLGLTGTGTVAAGSFHTPHPDPAQMGLSIGEGEEGSPALWGRWDGRTLSVRTVGAETVLLDASPSGRHLLATDVQQDALYLRAAEDGAVLRDLDAHGAVPALPGGGRVYWDFEAAFVGERLAVAGTSASDGGRHPARHWLVDTAGMTLRGAVAYPRPVAGPVRPAGGGAWWTVAGDGTRVEVWEPADEG